MRNGLFVTGTDTNVGKTVIAAALMHLCRKSSTVCYWKPVQTGRESDTAVVRALGECNADEILDEGIRFSLAASPHAAARSEQSEINVNNLLRYCTRHSERDRFWIVEGAGGVLVPLNDSSLMIDLIGSLNLPVLIVSSTRLGTINHTLLTLEALRRRGIGIAGIVLNGLPDTNNREAIEFYGMIKVLGELPALSLLNPEVLRAWATSHLHLDQHLPGEYSLEQ